MSYVTETDIAEKLRAALSAYGEVKPGTPLYDLCSVIGEEVARLNNDLESKADEGDGGLAITQLRTDIELLKKSRREDSWLLIDEVANKVAEILWNKLRKEREEDKSNFIEQLEKL